MSFGAQDFTGFNSGRGADQCGQDLLPAAVSGDLSVPQNDDLIRYFQDALLVGDDHDGTVVDLCAHFFEDLDQILEAPEIDACLGLIEDREPGAACQHCGDLDALELAAGEAGIDFTVDIVLGAEPDFRQILACVSRSHIPACRKTDQVEDLDAFEADRLLEGETDARLCALCDVFVCDILAVQQNAAGCGLFNAGDDLGECGLAAAVGAGNNNEFIVIKKYSVISA